MAQSDATRHTVTRVKGAEGTFRHLTPKKRLKKAILRSWMQKTVKKGLKGFPGRPDILICGQQEVDFFLGAFFAKKNPWQIHVS